MSATATRTLSIVLAKLRRMVALSAAFQAALGISGGTAEQRAALAAERVFLKSHVPDREQPFAVVSMGDSLDYQLVAGGDMNHLRPSGSVFLYLRRMTSPLYLEDRVSAEIDAWDFFSGVIEDVAAIAGADDANSEFGESHLSIIQMGLVGWGENPQEEWASSGRYYEAGILVNWGDG